jgi:hypothetical protein
VVWEKLWSVFMIVGQQRHTRRPVNKKLWDGKQKDTESFAFDEMRNSNLTPYRYLFIQDEAEERGQGEAIANIFEMSSP